jgi:hypothetical protein
VSRKPLAISRKLRAFRIVCVGVRLGVRPGVAGAAENREDSTHPLIPPKRLDGGEEQRRGKLATRERKRQNPHPEAGSNGAHPENRPFGCAQGKQGAAPSMTGKGGSWVLFRFAS